MENTVLIDGALHVEHGERSASWLAQQSYNLP